VHSVHIWQQQQDALRFMMRCDSPLGKTRMQHNINMSRLEIRATMCTVFMQRHSR
jgi:hypothetical protein